MYLENLTIQMTASKQEPEVRNRVPSLSAAATVSHAIKYGNKCYSCRNSQYITEYQQAQSTLSLKINLDLDL